MIRFQSFAKSCLGMAAGVTFAISASAQSQVVCFSDSISISPTDWNRTVTIPKFDTGLGTLQSIEFTLGGQVHGSAGVENFSPNSPTVANLNFSSTLTLTRPDLSVIVVTIPLANFVDPLTTFDGVIDFGGTSGVMHSNINASASNMAVSPPPASDLVLFSGPPGMPGTIVLPVTAVGSSSSTGGGNIINQFTTDAAAQVSVCYHYLGNTPPTFGPPTPQCGSTLMATAGVAMSFQVCAGDSNPLDSVTLTGTLPAGATTVPGLPAVGNPVCVTVNWTPTLAQLGNSVFSFVATDTHNRTAACQVNVMVAECYQFIGRGGTGSDVTIGGTFYHTQLSSVRQFWPVTMIDRPNLRVPNIATGQLNFSFQTLMHNPTVFPANPDQWSQRLRVTVYPGGIVTGQLFGDLNGIHQSLTTFTDPNGDLYMSFPFGIDGM